MNRIKILSSLLVNKIAAGEVIERPASVVKELIENALDAGAGRIEIEVADGGKKLIRVSDNGTGMSPADLEKAFLSHTTSKINTEEDLGRIQTFGFRGEALASIGAVSQARLTSKLHQPAGEKKNPPESYTIEINGGELSQPQPAAGSEGTTVEIRNLFFNTPARRKFLKSNAVEMGHLTEMVTRFGIAHPEIQFAVISNQKNILNLPPVSDVKERLRIFFGDELVSQLLLVENEFVRAYISNPLITKPTTRWQFFFLNRRFIRDRTISNAIRQAYYEIIPAGRCPAVFLFMNLPFGEYDVNVHPTKLEVRFRQGWQIHDNILGLVRNKLLDSELPAATAPVAVPLDGSFPLEAGSVLRRTADQPVGSPAVQQSNSMMQALVDFFKTHPAEHFQSRLPAEVSPPLASLASGGAQAGLSGQSSAGQVMMQPVIPLGRLEWQTGFPSDGHGVFQIHHTYIITEDRDGLLIFDQHALHERILFNRFKEEMRTAVIYRQKLLMPVLVELEMSELALLGEVKPYLEKAGLEIEEFGGRTVSIRAIPQILNKVNLPELLHELLTNFMSDKEVKTDSESESAGEALDEVIRLMACKAAVRAGDRLTSEEMQALLKAQESSGYTGTCPHGRPAVFKLTLAELEKYFQR